MVVSAMFAAEIAYNAFVVSARNVVLSENQFVRFEYYQNDEVPHSFHGESTIGRLRRNLRQNLNGFRMVREVHIYADASNIDWLCFFPEVEVIRFYEGISGYDNLHPLRSCRSLKALYCPYSDIYDLSALRELTSLQNLNLRGSLIEDIDNLRELPLRSLNVSQTRLATLEPLTKIYSLETLNLSGCQISDWPSLAPLDNIVDLNVSGSNIEDVETLAQATNLRRLNLAGTMISDIRPLAQLQFLETVDIRETEITDVSALVEFPALTHVSLEIAGETEEDIVRQLNALAKLQLSVSISLRINAPIYRVTSAIADLVPILDTLDLSETYIGISPDSGLSELLPLGIHTIVNARFVSAEDVPYGVTGVLGRR